MNSGIYEIRHIASGKRYVGSSVMIRKRWTAHRGRLLCDTHHSTLLQRAWNKYGEDAFAFEVLELCGVDLLIERENHHMQIAGQYNHAPAAGTTLGIKLGPLSDEHKAKLRLAHTGKEWTQEQRDRHSLRMTGRKFSDSVKIAMAKRQTGRKMAPLSPEHRAIVSATHKGKTISDEHKRRLSEAHTGRVQSDETRRKRSIAITEWHARRKASLCHTDGALPLHDLDA